MVKKLVGIAIVLGLVSAAALVTLDRTQAGAQQYALAELSVANLSCGSCVANIEQALGKVEGVGEVEVNVTSGLARVEFAPGALEGETVAARISEAGYPAQVTNIVNAADYRSLREDQSRLAVNYVGRIGERLISRKEFAAALEGKRRRMGVDAQGAVPGLEKTVWQEMLQRQVLLLAAEENGVVVQDGEVDAEYRKMGGQSDSFAEAIEKRYGGEQAFKRLLKQQMVIDRNIERHVLSDAEGLGDEARQQFLNRWYGQRVETTEVVIFDPALKQSLSGSGGCGGCC